MKRCLVVLMISICGMTLIGSVNAAEFPERDLQGVIMWGAGGATDNNV